MMSDRPEMVLRLTRSLARLRLPDPLPLRLCHAVIDVVDAQGGAISLGFSTSQRTLLCATSQAASRYEDAQDLVREGPSLDAFRTASAVCSLGEADQIRRWPRLAAALSGPAPGQVFALPMRPSSSVIGVLTIHHESAVLGSVDVMPELQFLADAVGAAIIGDLPAHDDPSELWSERDRISQATGMVVAQLGLDAPDALAVLRAHAFAQETSVEDVSRLIVARELDFRRGIDGGER
jgi:hypothetical protein